MVWKCLLSVVAYVTSCAALQADDQDPVRETLFVAKVVYDAEIKRYRMQVESWIDKREDSARQSGNKKLVDQIKDERKVFDESGEVPRGLPVSIQQKPALARKTLEGAYTQAIRAYVKTKKDDEAAAIEKELNEFRKENWKHLDLTRATIKDDYVRIAPWSQLPTLQKFPGAFEAVIVARTESENIRLDAQRGAVVIFNWELNPRELRVCRPDGNERLESGTIATAKVAPLKANAWYTLKWRVTEVGMQIWVDGKIVFEERKNYDLTATAPVTVRAEKSIVDVKEFRVISLEKPAK